MKKKTYLQPVAAVHAIDTTASILNSSPTWSSDGNSGTAEVNADEDAQGPAFSRRSVWDDEE